MPSAALSCIICNFHFDTKLSEPLLICLLQILWPNFDVVMQTFVSNFFVVVSSCGMKSV